MVGIALVGRTRPGERSALTCAEAGLEKAEEEKGAEEQPGIDLDIGD